MSFNPCFDFHRLNPLLTFTAGITPPPPRAIVMRYRDLSEHFNKPFYQGFIQITSFCQFCSQE